ncbi:MAG: hypothetical protein R3327_01715 [Nitrosopumilaceae archaeon]|nr:hypothetical protein [Nitrosopumilaceae archaeon]
MILKISIIFGLLLFGSIGLIIDNVYAQEKEDYEKQNDLQDKLKDKQEKLKEKQRELQEKFENKVQKLKQEHQKQIKQLSDKSNSKTQNLEEHFHKKSEKIIEQLEEKSETLNPRIQKLLEKINQGKYLGEKLTSNNNYTNYELVFNSVSAYGIGNNNQTSTLIGTMNFTTFDVGKSNLKLELEECHILVGDIPYNCGFGKARTISFGKSDANSSLVIIAFLEDGLANEVHTTLKIFLKADVPILQTETSSVDILKQSKISHLWFLNGTATLSKISLIPDVENNAGKEITINLKENISMSDK